MLGCMQSGADPGLSERGGRGTMGAILSRKGGGTIHGLFAQRLEN